MTKKSTRTGFPEDSKKFLKRVSDFQNIPDFGRHANSVFSEKILPQDLPVIENLRAQIAQGSITKLEAFARLTGISLSFLEIYNIASLMRERLNAKMIQDHMRQYAQWTRKEILTFVNNQKNQLELKKRPALTIAFYELLDKSIL